MVAYGALTGMPISPRRYSVVRVLQTTDITPQAKLLRQTLHKMPTENSPLLARNGSRRNSTRDALLNWKIICLLIILVVGLFIGIHLLIIEHSELSVNYPFHLINRDLWYQGDLFTTSSLINASLVSNVVVSHTRGNSCLSFSLCIGVISTMQFENVSDLPFNFLIGGDGKTYELRGWNYLSGFENLPYYNESIHVGLIGDFTVEEPTENQIEEVDALISESIRRRKLSSEYKILGLRKGKLDGHKMFKHLKLLDGWFGWI